MRLLHIITGLSTGGAERALHNLLSSGLQREFDCHVLSLTPGGRYADWIREQGIPVHSLNLRPGFSLLLAPFRLFRVLRAIRPDLIQGWMYHGNLVASLARGLSPGRPVVSWNVRQSLYDLGGEKFMTRQVIRAGRLLSSRADAIVYNSRQSRDQHERFGFYAASAHVIANGFDLAQWRPDEMAGERMRRALSIPAVARVVGHVARFHPMKDHAIFLRAAVEVACQLPDVHFLLVGRNVNLENPVLAGIVPSELQPRFHFLGERTDIPDLMRAMDVFCQSSWSEAFPNVLGEAMACGVPCVTTDVGDSALIVGETGEIVPPRDEASLAHGLLGVLEMAPEDLKAMGGAARRRIEMNFGLGSVVDQYARLYRSLVQKKGNQ